MPGMPRGRFPFAANAGNFDRSSTVTAILTADADGTLHLPLPAELRHGKVKVNATIERAEPRQTTGIAPQPGCLKGFWMAPDSDEPLEDFKEYMG